MQDPHRLGAKLRGNLVGPILILAISLAGIGVSVELTKAKFLLDYQPLLAPPSGCASSPLKMSCTDALTSAASSLFGLPLSLYGVALYTLAAIIAVGLFFTPRAFFGLGRLALVILAGVSFLISCIMGLYSLAMLDAFCFLCTLLYAVSGLFLVVAIATMGWLRAWELLGEARSVLKGVFTLLYLFVLVFGFASFVYQTRAHKVDPLEGLPEHLVEIPEPPSTEIILGASEPDLIVHAFVDLSCRHCRDEFVALKRLAEAGVRGYAIQVHLHLAPPDTSSTCTPPGYPVNKPEAAKNYACRASLAVECMVAKSPQEGLLAMEDFFGFQTRPDLQGKPYFADANLRVIAKNHGFRSESLDVNPVIDCVNAQEGPQEKIQANVGYSYELIEEHFGGPFRLPLLALVPVQNGVPDYRHAMLPKVGYVDSKTLESTIVKSIQDLEDLQRKFRR